MVYHDPGTYDCRDGMSEGVGGGPEREACGHPHGRYAVGHWHSRVGGEDRATWPAGESQVCLHLGKDEQVVVCS